MVLGWMGLDFWAVRLLLTGSGSNMLMGFLMAVHLPLGGPYDEHFYWTASA
jgi:hypothetical protein